MFTFLKKTSRIIFLIGFFALLNLPVLLESLHHHDDFTTHDDCSLCNIFFIADNIPPTSEVNRTNEFILVDNDTSIVSVDLFAQPLLWSPSNSPPIFSI
jgi:hypothetical protein